MNHILHVIGWIMAMFLFSGIIIVTTAPEVKHREKWCWGLLLSSILYMIAVTLIRW